MTDVAEKTGHGQAAVSIVIPVYKLKRSYLEKCVESCREQSYPHVEIILVDDGSPDDCGATCDEIAALDARIRVIHQQNAGVSAARNAGVHAARGEWVLFVDGDDWLETGAVSALLKEAYLGGDPDVVIFSLTRDYAHSSTAYRPLYAPRQLFAGEQALLQIALDVLEKPLADNVLVFPYCKLIKRSLLDALQPCFPEALPMCEDVVFSLRLLLHAKSVVYCADAFYHYRQHGGSAVNRYRPNAEAEQALLLRAISEIISQTGCPERFSQGYYLEAFYAMQRIIMQGYYNVGNPMDARERRKRCDAAFAKPPYRAVLSQIDRRRLSRNHRVKAFLIRFRLYSGLAFLRNAYYSLPGQRHSEA